MSNSFDGHTSEHDGAESNVDTLAPEDGEYGENDFDTDFPDETAEDADVATEDGSEDESGDDEPQKGVRHARGAKAAATARPKAGAHFGWSDVESILNFVKVFDAGTEKERTSLKAAFGVSAKADGLATAQALHGGGANLAVYKEATGFIDTIIKGKFDLSAIFGLISDLSKRDDDYVRDYFRAVNAFLPTEVRYRKNAPLPTLLEPLVMNAQSSLSEADRKTVKWIDDILSVWPK